MVLVTKTNPTAVLFPFSISTDTFCKAPWTFRDMWACVWKNPGFKGNFTVKASPFHLCKPLLTDIFTKFYGILMFSWVYSRMGSLESKSLLTRLTFLGSHPEDFSSFWVIKGALKKPRGFLLFPHLREMKTSKWREAKIIFLDCARTLLKKRELTQPQKSTSPSLTLPAYTCSWFSSTLPLTPLSLR